MRPEPVGVTFHFMAKVLALMLDMDRHPVGSPEGSGHMRLVPLLHLLHIQSTHPIQRIHLQLDVLELRMELDVRMDIFHLLKQSLVEEMEKMAYKITTMVLKITTMYLKIMTMILKITIMGLKIITMVLKIAAMASKIAAMVLRITTMVWRITTMVLKITTIVLKATTTVWRVTPRILMSENLEETRLEAGLTSINKL